MTETKRKIGVGTLWNLFNSFGVSFINLIVTLSIASILSPDAFGVIAICLFFVQLADVLVESGFGKAIIQKGMFEHKDINSVFLFNLCVSLCLYITICLCSDYISFVYDNTIFSSILPVIGLTIVFNSFKVVPVAVLSLSMNFKLQAYCTLIGTIISSIIALYLVKAGFGIWSLVVQSVVASLVTSLSLLFVSSWRPGLGFSRSSLVSLWPYSSNLLMEGFLGALFQNSYPLLISGFIGAELAGIYFLARRIAVTISEQVSKAVSLATFPYYSKLKSNPILLKENYRLMMVFLTFISTPILIYFFVFSDVIFSYLLSNDWKGTSDVIMLFCVMALLRPMHTLNIQVFMVSGRSDMVLKLGLLKKAINFLILLVSIYIESSIIGVVIGQIIGSVIGLFINIYYARLQVPYGFFEQFQDFSYSLIATLFCSTIVYLFLLPVFDLAWLIVGTGLFFMLYFVFYRFIFLGVFRRILQLVF